MRKKIVAGNWKMNLNPQEGKQLISDVLIGLKGLDATHHVVFAPNFLCLTQAVSQIGNTPYVSIAAQDCHQEKSGAYTGDISAPMLKSAGVQSVIIGHSERREYHNENNALLAQKVNTALQNGLQVIFCCGESLSIRESNTQNEFVSRQLEESLSQLSADEMQNIVIAYEPIWAIGTGLTASAAQAQDMHAHIRQTLEQHFGKEVAERTSILYGGSCKPGNAAELFAGADVDGGLIGGAALVASDFLGIIDAMVNS